MITQREQLEQLAKSDNGKVLMDWLADQIKQLTDIEKLTMENIAGKKEAVKVLKDLFSFLEKARLDEPAPKKTNYN